MNRLSTCSRVAYRCHFQWPGGLKPLSPICVAEALQELEIEARPKPASAEFLTCCGRRASALQGRYPDAPDLNQEGLFDLFCVRAGIMIADELE